MTILLHKDTTKSILLLFCPQDLLSETPSPLAGSTIITAILLLESHQVCSSFTVLLFLISGPIS